MAAMHKMYCFIGNGLFVMKSLFIFNRFWRTRIYIGISISHWRGGLKTTVPPERIKQSWFRAANAFARFSGLNLVAPGFSRGMPGPIFYFFRAGFSRASRFLASAIFLDVVD
jgi:hypothetical protein